MFAGQVFGKAGLFFSMMIYSRILEDGAFGELLLSVSIGFIVSFISDMGSTMLVTRRLSTGASQNRMVNTALLLRTALSAAALLSVFATVSLAGYSSRQILLVTLVSWGFIMDGFLESAYAVFRAREDMLFEGISRTLQGLTCAGMALFALFTDKGAVFAGISYAVRVFPSLLFAGTVLRYRMKYKPLSAGISLRDVTSLFMAALPLGISGMLIATGLRLDGVFIKEFAGDAAIAAYQQSVKLFETLVLIVTPTLVPGALFPALCLAVQKGWGEARMRLAWMTELFLVIAFLLIIPLWSGWEFILGTIWGGGFLRGVSPGDVRASYRILLLTLPVIYMFHMFLVTVIAAERQRRIIPAIAVSLSVEVALFLVLVPMMGIPGAAAAHFVFLLISAVWMAWDLHFHFGATGFLHGAVRPIASFIPALAVIIAAPFGRILNCAAALAVFAAIWIPSGGLKMLPGRRSS